MASAVNDIRLEIFTKMNSFNKRLDFEKMLYYLTLLIIPLV